MTPHRIFTEVIMAKSIRSENVRAIIAMIIGGVIVYSCIGVCGILDPQAGRSDVSGSWQPISTYYDMGCKALKLELDSVRKSLEILQEPENLANPKWNEARNRFNLLVQLHNAKQCPSIPDDQMRIPPAHPIEGSPEEVRSVGLKAIRLGRLDAAEIWLRQAAVAGDMEAQYNLGMLCVLQSRAAMDLAKGEAKKEEARKWLTRAASQGSKSAQDALGALEQKPR
jgi:TPR repeat protein